MRLSLIGETLRLIRVYNDKKLVNFADSIGVSAGYLSEIETGRKQPSLELIDKYSKEFDVPVFVIMFLSEQPEVGIELSKVKSFARRSIIAFLKKLEHEAQDVSS